MLLRPAPRGTGIIASKPIRAVLDCAGVKDAVSKSLGARNAANVVKATIQALMSAHEPEPCLKIKQATGFILRLRDPDWGNDNLLN